MDHQEGFEPSHTEFKAQGPTVRRLMTILLRPLDAHDIPLSLALSQGFEPRPQRSERRGLPIAELRMVNETGIEPASLL